MKDGKTMAGWNLKSGEITEYIVTEDKIWSLFNFVFSDGSKKRNTYKYGLIKALLDIVFNGAVVKTGIYYSYRDIFARFAENYWNLVAKYSLKQMRPDGKSIYSKVEKIIREAIQTNNIISILEFEMLDDNIKNKIISKVTAECRNCVIGALYEDFDGIIYSFDIKGSGIIINPCMHEFMLKYKSELERLNYYSWARFLEKVNDDNVLIKVIDKLELATPHRENLAIYREILRHEFEENVCFYCGKKLIKGVHVDHFIPWSFVKDDKLWNFVLSCPTCNEKKNNKLPTRDYIVKIEERNKKMKMSKEIIVQRDFELYTDDLLLRMWKYAKISGLKEFSNIVR